MIVKPDFEHKGQKPVKGLSFHWIVLLCLNLNLLMINQVQALQPLELTVTHTRDGVREFDGVDGYNFERLETQVIAPFIQHRSYAGNWFVGAEISENRLLLSGALTGQRRLYRFATPIQYFPRRVGRIQHEWMLTPAYYSDESLIQQKRFSFEYAWQVRYRKNRKVNFVGGLRNDSRFGGEGIHPIFGIESRPNTKIFHHWVFPDMYTEVQFKKRLKAKAFIQINGGNWRYVLADGTTTASLGLSDWKIGVGARLKTKMPFDIVAEAGMRIMGSGIMAGTTGNLSNTYYFSIGINTPFETNTSSKLSRKTKRRFRNR